jgi:hypothetical protein
MAWATQEKKKRRQKKVKEENAMGGRVVTS